MPRLFLGTYLDQCDQQALGLLPQLNPDLETKWHCRIKWSKPEQLHLTWIFFGNVEPNKIDSLCQAITETIKSRSINKSDAVLTYEKLECWFAGKIPKVLALTPNSINPNLSAFAKQIRSELSKYATLEVCDQSLNEYKPHITLARLTMSDEQRSQLSSVFNEKMPVHSISGLSDKMPINHPLEIVALIESTEQHGQHLYKTIQSFPLFR